MLRPVLFILFVFLFVKFPTLALLLLGVMNADKMTDTVSKRIDDWKEIKKRLPSLIIWVRKASFLSKGFKQDKSVTTNNILDFANMLCFVILVTLVTMYAMVRHIIG